ncbi:MAG: DUF2846 domain-containing protein [Marinirhabdus sp.]|nr:DUF2846 domain-containing protein [Marinirhabdus sp.]
MRTLVFLLFAVSVVSCSPKIKTSVTEKTYAPISAHAQVIVVRPGGAMPEESLKIGDVFIGDTGFTTDCGYDVVLGLIEDQARTAGANVIKITEIKTPSMGSTCYRIRADLYRNTNMQVIQAFAANRKQEIDSRLPEDADYAMVYFYRPENFQGSLMGFKIRMNNDSIIGRVRNGEKFAFKVTEPGVHRFWAAIENTEEVKVRIEAGKEYFFRCGVGFGVAVGRPQITQVDTYTGIREYEAMPNE